MVTGNRATRWLATPARARLGAAALAVCLLGGVSAFAATYNPEDLPPGQVSSIDQICRSTMGLQRGEEQYQGCLDSLMTSARSVASGLQMQDARIGCLHMGLSPGQPSFSECELKLADTQPMRSAALQPDGAPVGERPRPISMRRAVKSLAESSSHAPSWGSIRPTRPSLIASPRCNRRCSPPTIRFSG